MKYVKPKSLSWWASLVPLIAGLFMAGEPVHHLAQYVSVVKALFGGAEPAVLINAGLIGIGLRGAIK